MHLPAHAYPSSFILSEHPQSRAHHTETQPAERKSCAHETRREESPSLHFHEKDVSQVHVANHTSPTTLHPRPLSHSYMSLMHAHTLIGNLTHDACVQTTHVLLNYYYSYSQVPVHVLLELLHRRVLRTRADKKHKDLVFLLDNFPRNIQDLAAWVQSLGKRQTPRPPRPCLRSDVFDVKLSFKNVIYL
jgi:hypothetical protein